MAIDINEEFNKIKETYKSPSGLKKVSYAMEHLFEEEKNKIINEIDDSLPQREISRALYIKLMNSSPALYYKKNWRKKNL